MNAIIGKSFSQLRKSEQDRILKQMEDAMDEELCQAQFKDGSVIAEVETMVTGETD